MTNTKTLVITFWDNSTGENRPGIEDAVNTVAPVGWTEFTQPEDVTPGALAIAYGFYRNTNEYPTLTAATCPSLAPSSCRHFLMAYRTEGGDPQNYVTNFDEALGAQGASDILDWLAVWYPAVKDAVQASITSTTTHLEACRAIALAVNPTCPQFPL